MRTSMTAKREPRAAERHDLIPGKGSETRLFALNIVAEWRAVFDVSGAQEEEYRNVVVLGNGPQIHEIVGIAIIKRQHHGGYRHTAALQHLHGLFKAGDSIELPEKGNLACKSRGRSTEMVRPIGDEVVVENDDGKRLAPSIGPVSDHSDRQKKNRTAQELPHRPGAFRRVAWPPFEEFPLVGPPLLYRRMAPRFGFFDLPQWQRLSGKAISNGSDN